MATWFFSLTQPRETVHELFSPNSTSTPAGSGGFVQSGGGAALLHWFTVFCLLHMALMKWLN